MSTVTDDQAKAAVAENVTRLLEESGRSLYWLMQELGMSPGALYPIARGEKLPSIGTASRIAKALGVTIDELLERRRVHKKSKVPA